MKQFHAADYVVLVLVLLGSLVTGLFFACSGGRQRTTGEYFRGNRQLSVLPVSLSIMVSYISGILIIGTPAEVFLYGGMLFLTSIGTCLGAMLSAMFFVPLFYPLQLTSINTYLQMRFHSNVPKLMCTGANVLFTLLYTGLVIYAPAVTISTVTAIPTWLVVIVSAIIVIIYTSLGGLKAVIWTDVFQCVVMFIGIIAVAIRGFMLTGGISKAMEYVHEGGRLDMWNFDPDPRVRLTFWTMVPCSTFSSFLMYGATQTTLQRYCGLPSLTKSKLSMFVVMIFVSAIYVVTLMAGLSIYGYYSSLGCDPLSTGTIHTPNQLVPYFVMEMMNYPGVPGLFVAALCAGGLSSASSVLNAASANTWVDVIKPNMRSVSEKTATVIAKSLVVVYGVLAIGMTFLVMTLGGTVIQVSMSFNGAILVVVTGTIFFGALCPWANWKGATAGGLAGFSFTMWMALGSYMIKKYASDMLPLVGDVCSNSTDSSWPAATTVAPLHASPAAFNATLVPGEGADGGWLESLYAVTFHWYKIYGCVVILVVGSIVSLLTRCSDDPPVDKKLLFSFVRPFVKGNDKIEPTAEEECSLNGRIQ